jgi:ArsR family transcriptional regulator, virulence genes transcriptional regulator
LQCVVHKLIKCLHLMIRLVCELLIYDNAYMTQTTHMRKLKQDSNAGEANDLLNHDELKKAVLVLRAIHHKLRQTMIEMLEENERMTVTQMYVKLRLEQSVVSQHLAILRKAGIVKTDRNGKFIYYSINRDRIEQINELVEQLSIARI